MDAEGHRSIQPSSISLTQVGRAILALRELAVVALDGVAPASVTLVGVARRFPDVVPII